MFKTLKSVSVTCLAGQVEYGTIVLYQDMPYIKTSIRDEHDNIGFQAVGKEGCIYLNYVTEVTLTTCTGSIRPLMRNSLVTKSTLPKDMEDMEDAEDISLPAFSPLEEATEYHSAMESLVDSRE